MVRVYYYYYYFIFVSQCTSYNFLVYCHYVYPFHKALTRILEIGDQLKESQNNSNLSNECKLNDVHFIQTEASESPREHTELIKISQSLLSELPAFHSLVGDTHNEDYETQSSQATEFWTNELRKAKSKASELMELYSNSLEEKRNFLTFALTITTIMLSPMAILTGYWYNNFIFFIIISYCIFFSQL